MTLRKQILSDKGGKISLGKIDLTEMREMQEARLGHAKWSILARTLPDIFQITFSCHSYLIDDTQPTISSLGLSSNDLDRLRIICIFPDEPVEFLFPLTMGYLLQADISDEALSIVVDHLSNISGVEGRAQIDIHAATISDTAIFGDMPINLVEESIWFCKI